MTSSRAAPNKVRKSSRVRAAPGQGKAPSLPPAKGVPDSSSRASLPGDSSPVTPPPRGPAAARSQPHLRIDGRTHAGEGRKKCSALCGCRDVIEHQFICTAAAVICSQLNGRGYVGKSFEIYALYYSTVFYVKARNNTFSYHFATSIASVRSIAPI